MRSNIRRFLLFFRSNYLQYRRWHLNFSLCQLIPYERFKTILILSKIIGQLSSL